MKNLKEFVAEYEDIHPRYERFTSKLANLLNELLEADEMRSYLIESRTKSVESFQQKISRSDKSYSDPLRDVTDLIGIRVIVRSLDYVEAVERILVREFHIDYSRSTDKRELLDPDRFGYLSQHFVLRIEQPRANLAEWSEYSDLWAEVQVRTVLQHAWALISHAFDYKTPAQIPQELRRKLFRVSALLEVADSELSSFIKSVNQLQQQYRDRIAAQEEQIELNIDSLKAYIQLSEIVQKYANFIEGLGVHVGRIGSSISRDVEIAKMAGIRTIGEIDDILRDAEPWAKQYMGEFFYNTWGDPLPADRSISIDRNGIVTLFLIASNLDVFSEEVLDKKLGYGRPERATAPARKYNPKYHG